MKTLFFSIVLFFSIAVGNCEQTSIGDANSNQAAPPSDYQVVEKGADYRIWEHTTYDSDADGNVVPQKHRYTELGTGMHHFVKGQWIESKQEIDILPNGTAAATNGQHQAYFPGDIYNGEIEVVTPDGQPLQSRPLGLSYFDGKNSVLIAELKSSAGELVGSNQVIYPDAFTDFGADLRYTYTIGGFEQDVILRQQPPPPESFGLDPETTRLEILTEFFDTPDPKADAAFDGGDLKDSTLTFGKMKMVQGKAFSMPASDQTTIESVPVFKNWLHLDGRTFLVEELPVQWIEAQLEQLPLPDPASTAMNSANSVRHKVSTTRLLPPVRLVQAGTNSIQLATADFNLKPGVVLDYFSLPQGSSNFVFQADTTYLMSPYSYWNDGITTIEGGTVIKFLTNSGGFTMNYFVSVICKTGPYRPAIFTAVDDNTVGETIAGSTGTPSGYYGAQYGVLIYNNNNLTLHDIRLSYLLYGLNFNGYLNELDNIQAVNCFNPIIVNWGDATVNNGLFYNIADIAIPVSGGTPSVKGTHLTIHNCKTFSNAPFLTLTNCLLNRTTNILTGGGSLTTNNIVTITNLSGIFQSVGAGSHYLTNNSPYRNIGTTNIDAAVLANIKARTTFPPIVYSNVTFSVATNFSRQAQRDTNAPDLGYHYDPVDYITDGVIITNVTMTVTNGAVIACYNQPGILLRDNSSIASTGTPTVPNWFVRYQSVQELSVFLHGTNISSAQNISASPIGSSRPNGTFKFTRFATPASGGSHFNHSGISSFNNLVIQSSEFWGGTNTFSGPTNTATVTLWNDLFYRSPIYASNTVTTTGLSMSNLLIFGGSMTLVMPGTGAWNFFNNDVDSCTISSNSVMTNGYNAYLNCSGRVYPTNVNDIVSTNSLAYQTGTLGDFYQPTNSPILNLGSANADLVGLFHFTTQTNQLKETNSVVDIGYHYVATDANGNPLDGNGNGISDYLEGPFTAQLFISLILPATNSFYREPATVSMQATVTTSNTTVLNVEFLRNSTHIITLTNAPYTNTWPIVPAGAYALTAVARDPNGFTATSTVVNITVTNFCGSY